MATLDTPSSTAGVSTAYLALPVAHWLSQLGEPLWGTIADSSRGLIQEYGTYRSWDGFAIVTDQRFLEGQPVQIEIQRKARRSAGELSVSLGELVVPVSGSPGGEGRIRGALDRSEGLQGEPGSGLVLRVRDASVGD